MRQERFLLFLLLALCTIGFCLLGIRMEEGEPPRFEAPLGKIIVTETIVIDEEYLSKHSKGKTLDLKNVRYVWTGLVGVDEDVEGLPPIFDIRVPGVTFKNCVIEGSPDGIHVNADNVWIENVRFPNVWEDAVTFKPGADDGMIKRCYFAGASDKTIMLSNGKDHRVTECVFEDCETGIKVSHGSTARVSGNWFIDCQFGVRADGFDLETDLKLGENHFRNCVNKYHFDTKFGQLRVSTL